MKQPTTTAANPTVVTETEIAEDTPASGHKTAVATSRDTTGGIHLLGVAPGGLGCGLIWPCTEIHTHISSQVREMTRFFMSLQELASE